MAFLWERKDRVLRQATIVPVITPLLYGMSAAIAPLMAVALWLSAFDFAESQAYSQRRTDAL